MKRGARRDGKDTEQQEEKIDDINVTPTENKNVMKRAYRSIAAEGLLKGNTYTYTNLVRPLAETLTNEYLNSSLQW